MRGKSSTPGIRKNPPAALIHIPRELRLILRIYAAKHDITWKAALARAVTLLNADGALDELLPKGDEQ